jgi:hypothetical protein
VGGYVVQNTTLQATARTLDTTRSLYRAAIVNGRHVSIPVDVRPSVMPNCTIEYLVALASPTLNNNFRAIWSTNKLSQVTGSLKSRTMMSYEASGSGANLVPQGSATFTGGHMPVGQGSWLHVVAAFTHEQNLIQWYVNGIFSQSRVTTLVDGMDTITLGGVNGSGIYDMGGSMAVFRVWNRTLSRSEVYTLCTEGEYAMYSRPYVFTYFPSYVFNPVKDPRV